MDTQGTLLLTAYQSGFKTVTTTLSVWWHSQFFTLNTKLFCWGTLSFCCLVFHCVPRKIQRNINVLCEGGTRVCIFLHFPFKKYYYIKQGFILGMSLWKVPLEGTEMYKKNDKTFTVEVGFLSKILQECWTFSSSFENVSTWSRA